MRTVTWAVLALVSSLAVAGPPQWSARLGADRAPRAFTLEKSGRAVARAAGLEVAVSPSLVGVTSASRAWASSLALTGAGADAVAPATTHVEAGRVALDRGALVEWYVDTARGIEQGFTVHRPLSKGPLVIELASAGDLAPRLTADASAVDFVDVRGEVRWRYHHARAIDASGRPLRIALSIDGSRVRLTVDVTGASYPVLVDPLMTAADWETAGALREHVGRTLSAGDVNGDGFDDVLVATPGDDRFDGWHDGRVDLYFGSAQGLASAPAWSFAGHDSQAAGASVATGDIDGDGFADVAVLSVTQNLGFPASEIDVFFGSPDGLPADPGWRVYNFAIVPRGKQLALADVDGDGLDDLVFGLGPSVLLWFAKNGPPQWDPDQWLYLDGSDLLNIAAGDVTGDGKADLLLTVEGGGARLYLGSESGFAITPAWTDFGKVASIEVVGDVNGDGTNDVALGRSANQQAVVAEVRFGTADGLHPAADWSVALTNGSHASNAIVAGAGDVDRDGYADLLVGAPDWNGFEPGEGRAWLFRGGPSGPAHDAAWQTSSFDEYGRFGAVLSPAGDVDHDGLADFLVAAPQEVEYGVSGEGHVYLYRGGALIQPPVAACPADATWTCVENGRASGTLDASASRDPQGLALTYEWSSDGCWFDGQGSARPVAHCALGLDEVILRVNNGVVSSDPCRMHVTVVEPEVRRCVPLHDAADWIASSREAGDWFGYSVAWADVDADGFADLVVGAPMHGGEHVHGGAVYVFRGSAAGLEHEPSWRYEGEQGNQNAGYSVASAGDVNGDGFEDVVVGSLGIGDVYPHFPGRAALFLGGPQGLAPAPAWSVDGDPSLKLRFSRGVGDLNGDGFDDLAISRMVGCGVVDIHFGSPSGPGPWPDLQIGDPVASTYPESCYYFPTGFGTSVSAGDADGDGTPDLAVSAPYWELPHLFLHRGTTSGPEAIASWAWSDQDVDSWTGLDLDLRADTNHDGLADLIASGPWSMHGNDIGYLFGFPGRAAALPADWPEWRAHRDPTLGGYGSALSTAGDLNGDGIDDVITTGAGPYLADGPFSLHAFLGSPGGLSSQPAFSHWSADDGTFYGLHIAGGRDANGDGRADVAVGAWMDRGQGRGYVEVRYGLRTYGAPVAACPAPATWECTGNSKSTGELDGSRSSDPLGEAITYAWSSTTCTVADPQAAIASATCPLGESTVALSVEDSQLQSFPCTVQVTVVDTQPPAGTITAPVAGQCFGPAALPVVVVDDMRDACAPELTRTYEPPGGSYTQHGDVHVRLTARDASGNAGEASVAFTIDTVAPTVKVLAPPARITPVFATLFTDADDDGATGGVLHETVAIDGCVAYDGRTYGNADGLLRDEAPPQTQAELCRIARLCGRTEWHDPVFTVTVEDCGGNRASASTTLRGTYRARCNPDR